MSPFAVIALSLLGLGLGCFQMWEFQMAKHELAVQQAYGKLLAQSVQANKTLPAPRHVFFSTGDSSAPSRKSALLLPRVSVLFFDSAPANLSSLFLEAMSVVPDAATYTYVFNPSAEFTTDVVKQLDSAVFSAQVLRKLSSRFLLFQPDSHVSVSRKIWDWNRAPRDTNVRWIVLKAIELNPLISVVGKGGDFMFSTHPHPHQIHSIRPAYTFKPYKWLAVIVGLGCGFPALTLVVLPRVALRQSKRH
ncbi:hypothetical protein BASA81_000847 [Batrachochytrium salamandrivorans]|nr:hypothetical protein BASA81_000847 [Batrachochytrium salamandrivorans]